jgi:hypothetical protein
MPPGITGLEATKQILKLKPEIKILNYTTDFYAVEDMIEAGAMAEVVHLITVKYYAEIVI